MIHLRSCGKVLSPAEELTALWLISLPFQPLKVKKINSVFSPISVYWDQKILADHVHIVLFQGVFVGLQDKRVINADAALAEV